MYISTVDFLIDFWYFVKYNLDKCIKTQNFLFCEIFCAMCRLTLLTSRVQQLTTQHEALSILAELDTTRILLNCGYGVLQSLLEIGIYHSDINHMILPHFQPEYVADLLPFLHASVQAKRHPHEKALHIYGKAEVRQAISTFIDIFTLNELQLHNIMFHEIMEADEVLDMHSIAPFCFYISKNHFLYFSLGGKRYTIIEDISPEVRYAALLNSTDLAVINANTIQEDALVNLIANTDVKHIIYVSTYNESNPYRLQKIATDKGYQGSISIGHNLMSFML
jgi:ribonuclease BN (tRNA processing enzyme)